MLAALILVGDLAAPGIAASGHIDAPEGFRARLPTGFRYAVDAQDGHTYYRAADPAGTAVVSVGMGPVESATRCDATGEVEAQPGVRTRVSPVRTRAGLSGCVIRGRSDGGAVALVVLPAPGGEVVVVAGVARGPDRAEKLARGVAESVSFPPAPRVDPRLVGCFAREGSRSTEPDVENYLTVSKRVERCFFPDRRYRSSTGVSVDGRTFGKKHASGDASEGKWSYRDGALEVQGDETWRARVGFAEGDLLLDGARWQRQRAQEPEDDEAGEDG